MIVKNRKYSFDIDKLLIKLSHPKIKGQNQQLLQMLSRISQQKHPHLPQIKHRAKTEAEIAISNKIKEQKDNMKTLSTIQPYLAEINRVERIQRKGRFQRYESVSQNKSKAYYCDGSCRHNRVDCKGQTSHEKSQNQIYKVLEGLGLDKSNRNLQKYPQRLRKSVDYRNSIDQGNFTSSRPKIKNFYVPRLKTQPTDTILSQTDSQKDIKVYISKSLSIQVYGTQESVNKCDLKLRSKIDAVFSAYTKQKNIKKSQFPHRYIEETVEEQTDETKTKRYLKNEQLILAFESLPEKKANLSPELIQKFLQRLKKSNSLFERINSLSGQVLIRFTSLKIVRKEQFLYFQGKPSKHIYLVLWGQFLLKTEDNTFTKYAFPGDSLSQELLFVDSKYKKLRLLSLKRQNEMAHLETAKSLTESCVMVFTKQEFQEIKKDLTLCGAKFKWDIQMIENMMKWCFSKKLYGRSMMVC